MKSNILTIMLVFIVCVMNAQKKPTEVPQPVMDAFKSKYPGITVKEWEKEKEGHYEAEFEWNGAEKSATFSSDGVFIESEQEIKIDELPPGVKEHITRNYPGFKIEEACKITTAKNEIMFEAEVEKGKEEFDLVYDMNSNFLKKEDGDEKGNGD